MGSWSDRRPPLLNRPMLSKFLNNLQLTGSQKILWKDAIKLSVGNFTTISSKPLPPACLQESLILCTKFKVGKIEQVKIGLQLCVTWCYGPGSQCWPEGWGGRHPSLLHLPHTTSTKLYYTSHICKYSRKCAQLVCLCYLTKECQKSIQHIGTQVLFLL